MSFSEKVMSLQKIMHADACQSKAADLEPKKVKFVLVETFTDLRKKRIALTKLVSVKLSYIDEYLDFLDSNPVLKLFFKWDSCMLLADRYLIAMVFVYFSRACFTPDDYTPYSFFVALYLAHDIEEDDKETKHQLYIWALGAQWPEKYRQMLRHRNAFWRAMNHRAIVSRKCCEMVMALRPEHTLWKRNRAVCHGGAKRKGSSYCCCCSRHCSIHEDCSDPPKKKISLDLQVSAQ